MTEERKPEVSAEQAENFTMFLAFATQGILASIPFGVSVDPNAVATAAKNVALSMLQVKQEATS